MKVNFKNISFVKKEYEYCFISNPFRIFYNLSKDDKTPANLKFSYKKDIPDYIINIFKLFFQANEIYTKKLKLRNPLKEGIYFDKGAEFIDILIVDIPKQKGLVASELVDNSEYFLEEDMKGKAVKIQIHNDLIEDTATPIHELFHVFQYNYCNFNNMWFMEGLARWSQNLIHKRQMKDEILPQTIEELDSLLLRAHDAEYFFRKLFFYVDDLSSFIKNFLLNCELEEKELLAELKIEKIQKKSIINNLYVLNALLKTFENVDLKNKKEIRVFLEVIELYIIRESKKNVLHNLEVETYHYNSYDNLHMIEGDLIISDTNLKILDGFNRIKQISGTLKISDNKVLEEINGFHSLEYVKNIEITHNESLENIYALSKFFLKIKRIDGYIKITSNKKLRSIAFLRGLEHTGSSLYLHNNNLTSLKGLEYLTTVVASLSLSSNSIKSLEELNNLKKVYGLLSVAHNKLVSLKGLENLEFLKTTVWNSQSKTILLNGNPNLKDIKALENILTYERYLIIYTDDINQYKIKPNSNSNFHKNILELYDTKNKCFIPTYEFVEKTKHNYEYFGRTTHNEKLTHLFDFEMKSDILVISFSGYGGHLGGVFNSRYPFITNEVITNKIFILDNSDSWYHNGSNVIANSIDEIVNLLSYFIKKGNYKKILCIGSSMGGYMALIAGKLLNVTNVLAFSPQTFIDNKTRKKFSDKRWNKELSKVNEKYTKYLNIKELYKNSNINNKIEIHYSESVPLDEVHALYLDDKRIKLFSYKNCDHYVSVYLHEKRLLEDMVLKHLGMEKPKKSKNKILFADKWQSTLKKCSFIEAYHTSFSDIKKVIDFALDNKINILFGNNYSAQKAIAKNEKLLKEKGLKFLVNTQKTLKHFVDKKLFYDLMLQKGYEQYVPKYYSNENEVIYPCIVKTISGGAGRGIFIAYSKDEITFKDKNLIISEYLPSKVEYATTIFMKKGKIIEDFTFSKKVEKDFYVLQAEKKETIKVEYCETPFLELFEEIVSYLSSNDEYCQCSINFKIENNIPKIFEINPRVGYTLSGFPTYFEKYIDRYMSELDI